MKYIMLSRFFPATHPRKGEPTGFIEKILKGEKIHTIRANSRGHYQDGDELSLRYWSGKPYCSKQVEFHRCRIRLEPVKITFRHPTLDTLMPGFNPEMLANNDGLKWYDFYDWFNPSCENGKVFKGDIVHFTGFRYGKYALAATDAKALSEDAK